MLNVKQDIYTVLAALSVPVKDNPNGGDKNKPLFGILRTINTVTTDYKNYTKNNWLLRLDLFSTYKGEKEILDYYNNEVIPALRVYRDTKEEITYITPTCEIMDDDAQGPIMKHGVVSIAVDTMEVK